MKPATRALTLALAVLSHLATARAQSAADKAAAAQLFDEARELDRSGQAAKACGKYVESQRLDPQLGTLLYLGDCYDRIGKTASAWASFKDAVEIAARRGDGREEAARNSLKELEGRLARLTIELGPDAPPNVSVFRNGSPVASALLGSAIPVDPGEQAVVARADGFVEWSTTVTIAKVENTVVVVSGMQPLVVQSPSSQSALPAPRAGLEETAAPADTRRLRRRIGYAVGAVGVVGVVMGGVFALVVNSKLSDRDAANACSSHGGCTEPQIKRIDQLTTDARRDATWANVGFIAGGVALLTGSILVMTGWQASPTTSSVVTLQPWVAAGTAGLGARGSF